MALPLFGSYPQGPAGSSLGTSPQLGLGSPASGSLPTLVHPSPFIWHSRTTLKSTPRTPLAQRTLTQCQHLRPSLNPKCITFWDPAWAPRTEEQSHSSLTQSLAESSRLSWGEIPLLHCGTFSFPLSAASSSQTRTLIPTAVKCTQGKGCGPLPRCPASGNRGFPKEFPPSPPCRRARKNYNVWTGRLP